ncbi:MAG: hypothetical protein NXI14_02010 [bacterium]|nr:hypothetical protein [bacterium]
MATKKIPAILIAVGILQVIVLGVQLRFMLQAGKIAPDNSATEQSETVPPQAESGAVSPETKLSPARRQSLYRTIVEARQSASGVPSELSLRGLIFADGEEAQYLHFRFVDGVPTIQLFDADHVLIADLWSLDDMEHSKKQD